MKDRPILMSAPMARAITLEKFTELAHRTAIRYSHRSEPARAFYTFSPETLADFHRQVCAAVDRASLEAVPEQQSGEDGAGRLLDGRE